MFFIHNRMGRRSKWGVLHLFDVTAMPSVIFCTFFRSWLCPTGPEYINDSCLHYKFCSIKKMIAH